MNSDMMEALENIEREKGISVEIMLEALANALVTAYKRLPNAAEEALVEIDAETGDIRVIAQELDEEGNVTCPWHAWRFCVTDGKWVDNPRLGVDTFEVRVAGDDVHKVELTVVD